jgi:Uncharacterized protein family UPF0029
LFFVFGYLFLFCFCLFVYFIYLFYLFVYFIYLFLIICYFICLFVYFICLFVYFICAGKFQAHLAIVHSVEDAQAVIAELMRDKKIATATHNISSYRIVDERETKHENRDDDGETGAGDKLLYPKGMKRESERVRERARESESDDERETKHENRDDGGEPGAGDKLLI